MAIDLITTVAAIMSISILSIPFKESMFSRVGEFFFIALAGAVGVWATLTTIYSTGYLPLMAGNYLLIVPFILGGVIILRPFVRQLKDISLWPLALVFGYQIGNSVGGSIVSDIWNQVKSTIKISTADPFSLLVSLMIIGLIAVTLISFTTTIEHKGAIGKLAAAGRMALLIAFALGFGVYMMGRFGLYAARLQYLIYSWLGLKPLF